MIDADALERLEEEVESLRRAVRESAAVADRLVARPWPSPTLAATLMVVLFAVCTFFIGRLTGMTMARSTDCRPLPPTLEATMTVKTPLQRTITLSTDGQVAIADVMGSLTNVRRRQVDPKAVRALVDRLMTSCFFEMHSSYASPGDEVTNELSITAGTRAHTVRHPVRSYGEFAGGCAPPHDVLLVEADAVSLATRD